MQEQLELETPLEKIVSYFELMIQKDKLKTLNHLDLACFYKLPMFFLEAEKPELARKVLDFICEKFLMLDGDFKTQSNLKSIKPEYNEYWTYINGWILRAAHLTDYILPEKTHTYFQSYYLGEGRFSSQNNQEFQITDVLTIAHHGLIYLESSHDSKWSNEAADFLCYAYDQQPEVANKFFLRFYSNKQVIDKFDLAKQVFFSVDKNQCTEQLYFMLAYPCAFLALHHRKTGDIRSLYYAEKYMEFLVDFGEKITSRFSHKTAWAASILLVETNNDKYLYVIQKITNFFISMQSNDGLWFMEEGVSIAYDQTAEIGCWFSEIIKNVNLYEEQSRIVCSC